MPAGFRRAKSSYTHTYTHIQSLHLRFPFFSIVLNSHKNLNQRFLNCKANKQRTGKKKKGVYVCGLCAH